MQKPRGIGAHVFHLYPFCILGGKLAVFLPRLENLPEGIIEHIGFQIEVEEPWARNLRALQPVPLHALRQLLGNLSGVHAEHLRRLHGKIRGKVAKLLLRRNLQRNLRELPLREHAIRHGRPRRLLNGLFQCLLDIQVESS